MRKVIAIAAVPGLIAGIYIFAASFFGLTMDKLGAKAFLLHLGLFAIGNLGTGTCEEIGFGS
jgi:hypothetical protein